MSTSSGTSEGDKDLKIALEEVNSFEFDIAYRYKVSEAVLPLVVRTQRKLDS